MPRAADRIKLNETIVKRLEPPSRDEAARLYRDSVLVGFACRVSYGGTKAFVLHYTTKAGRERRYTIGKYPAWRVDGARERAKELRRLVDLGGDPMADDQEARHAITFGELVEEYEARYVTRTGRRLRDGHKDLRVLALDALPIWKHRPAAGITRAEIRKLVEAKAEATPQAGNRLLETIFRVFNFGIDRELLTGDNPAGRLKRPAPKVRKDRALNEREIQILWEGLEAAGTVAADVLKLILLTGQRPGECCEVGRSEIELDTALWFQGEERARAQDPTHEDGARDHQGATPEGPLCVPREAARGLLEAEPAALLRERKHFGIPHFTAHDLRRSAATNMARIGVPRLTIAKILNHTESRDTTAIYERYSYLREQREALERWERELLRIIGTPRKADVVEMAR